MATLFADSSSLAKRYITETGTAWIKNILDPTTNNDIYIVRVTTVEMIAPLPVGNVAVLYLPLTR